MSRNQYPGYGRTPATTRAVKSNRATVAHRGAIPAQAAFTPASLKPIFWADPSNSGTLSLTGSTINSISDAAGGPIVLTKSGTPTLDSTHLLNGRPAITLGTNGQLTSSVGGVLGSQPHSMYMVCDLDVAAVQQPESIMVFGPPGSGTTSPLGLWTQGWISGGDNIGFEPQGRTPVNDNLPHVIGAIYDGRVKYMTMDGAVMGDANNIYAHQYAITSTAFGFGKFNTNQTNGSRVRQALWFNRVLAPAELVQLVRYWNTQFSLASTAPIVYNMGDSLTYGSNSSNPGVVNYSSMMMTRLNALLTAAGKTNATNYVNATPGRRIYQAGAITDMTAYTSGVSIDGNTSTSAVGYSSPRRSTQIYTIMGGTNDLISDNASAATIIARLTTCCAVAKSAGYKVVILTMPPGSPSTGYADSSVFHPIRVAANNWIKNTAVSSGVADAVVDSESTGLVFNATYYGADLIHPNDAGYQLIANAAAPVLYSLFP